MADNDSIEFDGVVTKAMGNGIFTVKVSDSESNVICTLSGKIRKNAIRILEGDSVKIEVSPYDMSRGRICYRNNLRKQEGQQNGI